MTKSYIFFVIVNSTGAYSVPLHTSEKVFEPNEDVPIPQVESDTVS